MNFVKISRSSFTPSEARNVAFLKEDNWDDYSFVTMFYLTIFDENGGVHKIGNVKIGYVGQKISRTTDTLPDQFSHVGEGYFSLGQELEYYQNIRNELSLEVGDQVLTGLRDIAFREENYTYAQNEDVFKTSLLRSVSLAAIKGQFKRILSGGIPLTDFKFHYRRPPDEEYSGIEMKFCVESESEPSTNIHALIGRNGVGKTTLLNNMIESILDTTTKGGFYDAEGWQEKLISKDYFSSLVSVSFSAFDPFDPPPERSDPTFGACYYYTGLKNKAGNLGESELKTLCMLRAEFCTSVALCLSQPGKKRRWLKAIEALESDENFAEMRLSRLANEESTALKNIALGLIKRMSSGHAIVLLSITKLVETVEEKTLVLIDEPESHLHPPLLSALVRALSELLYNRNGVCIIATHSPVILQEIPRSCVWKITRSRLALSVSRPNIETFGENVGVLTREVFGLEVTKSGFHQILAKSVAKGGNFEDIINEYNHQLGFEAQAILRAMIAHRDNIGGQH